MKRLISFIFIMIFIYSFCGCNNDSVDNYNSNKLSELSSDLNEKLIIYDNNSVFDTIEIFGNILQTNDGFIYSKYIDESSGKLTEMEYYRYIFNTKKSVRLGSIKDWSLQTNEAEYINNHIYYFVSTGDITSYEDRKLKFIDIDLNNNTMSELSSETGGFPYNSMAAAGNLVLMSKVLKNGSCLEAYNTETKEIRTLKSFNFDDKNNIGEAVRKISVNEQDKTISLLMLKITAENNVSLSIETYDYDMNLLDTIDISTISSDNNELCQGVSFFDYTNNYVYYENFSITRFLGLVNKSNLEKFNSINETFQMVHETVKDNEINLFYQLGDENNYIYLFNTKVGTLKKSTFKADDDRYYITNMSKDNENNLIILMDYKNPDTSERLDTRLYFIRLNDLKFQ